jgi:hypothetical protein
VPAAKISDASYARPCSMRLLDLLQHTLLELPLNLLALVIRTRLAVQRHQSTQVELGSLQQLNLANVNLHRYPSVKLYHQTVYGLLTFCKG